MSIFSLYFLVGGSFIWESDSFTQHFQLFDDYVKILQGLFKGDGFPQWSWSIGPGADVISSYGYYVLGDPFVYLGIFFPEALREFSYHFLILLRVWAIGASFLLYARRMKFSHKAGMMGAIIYAFSYFAILNINRHPFFLLPMIWLPLFALAIEKILHKESSLLFSLVTTLGAVSNFYFFYKLTILVFIYALARYVEPYGFKDIKQFFTMVSKATLHYLLGIMLSAALFLPMAMGFLNSSRSTEGVSVNLLYYPLDYYVALVHNLFVPKAYFWSVGGFSLFTLFGMYYLWKTRKEPNATRVMLTILGVFLLFPFFGSMMNGFSGPYNRFSFAIAFFLAVASGRAMDHIHLFTEKDIKRLSWILIFFTLLYTISAILYDNYLYYLLPIIIGWGMWYVLWQHQNQIHPTKRYNLLLALVVVNVIGNAWNYYLPHGDNSISTTHAYNTSITKFQNYFGGLETELPSDDGVYRVGNTSQDRHTHNQYIYHDVMGMSSYLSITNRHIAEFSQELNLAPYQIIQPLRNGLDNRRLANYFMNVRYIISSTDNEGYLPAGYTIQERNHDGTHFLAKTENAYPFAYVMNDYLSYESFSEMTPLEKEVALTEAVVLENVSDSLSEPSAYEIKEVDTQVTYHNEPLTFNAVETVDVTKETNALTVNIENIAELDQHELYISLEGMNYKAPKSSFYSREKSGYDVVFQYNDQDKSFRQSDKYVFSTYFHRPNFFVNLGEVSDLDSEITIEFKDTGRYDIEQIMVYALPINQELDQQLAIQKHDKSLAIDTFEDEYIKGTLTNSEEGILVTTIPYEAGWQAMVDGQDREITKANISFIGVPISEGDTTVEFHYQNPYVIPGLVISLFGLAGILGIFWYEKRLNHK